MSTAGRIIDLGKITTVSNLLVILDSKINFGDTAVSVWSDDDGHLDLTADVSVDVNSPILSISGIITSATGYNIVCNNNEVVCHNDEVVCN